MRQPHGHAVDGLAGIVVVGRPGVVHAGAHRRQVRFGPVCLEFQDVLPIHVPPFVPSTSIASESGPVVERSHASAAHVATHHPLFGPAFDPSIPCFLRFVARRWKGRGPAVLVGVTSAAHAASVAKHERYDAQVTIEGQQMAVVKVTAKRLAAADKAAI
ncbi:conserved hypothetical protein [Ricinus communis]|uniref:Uncharacterized protein n=1 Tax=Ricinus communis TaxID=3988 RepID=B9TKJ3_RICCO|nr:conserved hypothetical protein [Ricinus communis]